MKLSAATELHSIFRVDHRGDTLIITPRGDAAGFGGAEFYREQAAVQQILKDPGVKNLVVDLGEATYYGSTVIGAINRFGIEVRSAGGRIALCRVSDDTRYILRTMKLDELWEHFPSRGQALAVMVSRPMSERLRPSARWGLLLVGIGGVALLYGLLPGRKVDRGYHHQLMAVYLDMQELSDRGATPAEWDAFTRQTQREVGPILADLNETATSSERAKQYLLFAARDYLLPLVARRMADVDGEFPASDEMFCTYMVLARCAIDGREPPERYRRPPQQPAEQPAEQPTEQPTEQPAEQPAEPPLPLDAEGNPLQEVAADDAVAGEP
jgi:anti-anti-sigma regulatory factor